MKRPNWQKVVKDRNGRKVFKALANPEWDFRTVRGLINETGLSPTEIHKIFSSYPQLVRKSLVPSREGRDIYALHSRGNAVKETLNVVRAFMSKSVK